MELKGDTGARKIIEQHSNEIATVLFTQGNIDIDTEADYKALIILITIYPIFLNFLHCEPVQIHQ